MSVTSNSTKFSFSGHESFVCKHFWLKKLFDFAADGKRFSEDQAVVHLGVGKNMVSSMRYWGKAFGILTDNDETTDIANYLFGKNGRDPYLEDIGTIWLLHLLLVTTEKASLCNLVFNEFRKERIEFNKDHLLSFVKRKCLENGTPFNPKTVFNDISVFFRSYVRPERSDKMEIEDAFTGLLIDLELVRHYKHENVDAKSMDWYRIEPSDRLDLPPEIVLFSILNAFPGQTTITFRELLVGYNSPGNVFALSSDALINKLHQISRMRRQVLYSETAGNQVLQLKGRISSKEILDEYYR